MEFLGHSVSARGISPLPGKIEAEKRFEQPQSVKSLQRFLGLVNFYRGLLPNVAETLRPLTEVLVGAPRQLKWTEAMMSMFRQVKQRLASAMLLVHPVPDTELHVKTDTSTKAIA